MPERSDTPGNEVARSPLRWQGIAGSAEFRGLESLRRRAMAATLGIFAVAVGAFLVLGGYAAALDAVLGFLTISAAREIEQQEQVA